MKRELEESARERERLQRRIERLGKQYTRLKRELDAARRAGYRQAAPFAKTVTLEPKRPGRRGGDRAFGAAANPTRSPSSGGRLDARDRGASLHGRGGRRRKGVLVARARRPPR